LNNRGQIVGTAYDNAGLSPKGFLYSRGTFSTIEVGFPNIGTFPSAINNQGDIVGSYYDANTGPHGFIRTEGTISKFPDPEGAVYGTILSGINDRGQIVGWFFDASSQTHGFMYSKGRFYPVDDPLAGTGYYGGTYPSAIDEAGEIAGFYIDSAETNHGFIYTGAAISRDDGGGAEAGSAFFTVDDPSGPFGTSIYGLNNSGRIVGGYDTSYSTTGNYGFVAAPKPEREER
jgi:probable HAF family extracellular repeat protein